MVLLQVPSARTKYVVEVTGLTEMLLPVPIGVPEQLLLNHLQMAPLPRVPPFTLRVMDDPLQTVDGPDMELAGREESRTVTIAALHGEFLHVPSARTK